MSCITCQAKFSFFTKENGCPSCGFSYCSKCLKYKYSLPNIGEKKICGRCFNKFQTKAKACSRNDESSVPDGLDEPLVPIDITKRLESLENPARPPITMYRQGSKLDRLGDGLDPVDQEIVNRLKKLRNEDKRVPLPTEDDIRRRLALLKDQDPDIVSQPMNLNQVDNRTTQQKTDDLIKEYLERLEISKIDEKTNSDIQARLDNLRGRDSAKYVGQHVTEMEEVDDETATKRIIKKALAEVALEAKFGDTDELEEFSELTPTRADLEDDDLEQCVMCDKTKNLLVCNGCNGDLFCAGCFADNHDDFEIPKHPTRPFKQRRLSD